MQSGFLDTIRAVFYKEITDLLRDPRTLILSIVLPLILFPLLFWVLSQEEPIQAVSDAHFRVATIGEELESPSLNSPQLEIVPVENFDKQLLFDGFDIILETESNGNYFLYFDNINPSSINAASLVSSLVENPKQLQQDSAEKASPIILKPLLDPELAAGRLFLALLLPFMILIFAVSCPLPIAADLSAGERERGSLEPLLATAAPRGAIVAGKELALLFASLASVGAYFLGVYLSYRFIPSIAGPEPMQLGLNFQQVVALITFIILATALFAALQLLLGTLTRSVREAQLSGMPLLILSMGAVYLAQNSQIAPLPAWKFHIPVVNLALLIRIIAIDRFSFVQWLLVVVWTLIYIILILSFTIGCYRRERAIKR